MASVFIGGAHLYFFMDAPGSGLSVIAAPLLLVFLVIQAVAVFWVAREAASSKLPLWQIILSVVGVALLLDFTCIGLPVGLLLYFANAFGSKT